MHQPHKLAAFFEDGPYTVSTFDPRAVLPDSGLARLQILALQKSGTSAQKARPVFPILVSSRVYAPLLLSLDVVRLGEPFTTRLTSEGSLAQIAEAERLAGPGTTPIGISSRDISDDTRPLRPNPVTIPWPGTTGWTGSVAIRGQTTFTAQLTARPVYLAAEGGSVDAPRFQVVPQGVVGRVRPALAAVLVGSIVAS